jgi:6-phosphogluconate dehydrogenase
MRVVRQPPRWTRGAPKKIDSAEVGVIGMAVMGSSLARNMARHEYRVALFNRTYGRAQQ